MKVQRLLEASAAPSLRVPDATVGSYPLHAAAHAQAPAAIAVLMEWHMPRAPLLLRGHGQLSAFTFPLPAAAWPPQSLPTW